MAWFFILVLRDLSMPLPRIAKPKPIAKKRPSSGLISSLVRQGWHVGAERHVFFRAIRPRSELPPELKLSEKKKAKKPVQRAKKIISK